MKGDRYKLDELQNQYPPEIPISDSYEKNGSAIRFTGLYDENFVEFKIVPISDIKIGEVRGNAEAEFNFIVRFVSGGSHEDWTSQTFKNFLRNAISEPNPYYKRTDVTVVSIAYDELKDYYKDNEMFVIPEEDAGVTITKTITTKQDMFKHISWMISKTDVNLDLRPISEFGAYEINQSGTITDNSTRINKEQLEGRRTTGMIYRPDEWDSGITNRSTSGGSLRYDRSTSSSGRRNSDVDSENDLEVDSNNRIRERR